MKKTTDSGTVRSDYAPDGRRISHRRVVRRRRVGGGVEGADLDVVSGRLGGGGGVVVAVPEEGAALAAEQAREAHEEPERAHVEAPPHRNSSRCPNRASSMASNTTTLLLRCLAPPGAMSRDSELSFRSYS